VLCVLFVARSITSVHSLTATHCIVQLNILLAGHVIERILAGHELISSLFFSLFFPFALRPCGTSLDGEACPWLAFLTTLRKNLATQAAPCNRHTAAHLLRRTRA